MVKRTFSQKNAADPVRLSLDKYALQSKSGLEYGGLHAKLGGSAEPFSQMQLKAQYISASGKKNAGPDLLADENVPNSGRGGINGISNIEIQKTLGLQGNQPLPKVTSARKISHEDPIRSSSPVTKTEDIKVHLVGSSAGGSRKNSRDGLNGRQKQPTE